ncbi:macrolide ABC transporter ATP-binding protein [Candidatus Endoriftia persephone str. Guaymas]|nr:macrolide ABC transporter ATP-binding protein [Candidatus Endoriftia persephone str. Guaymas]
MHQKILLSVRGASRIFSMGDVQVPALRDASLEIYDGEFLVIVGPSGSGKSTLLNLIGGMDRPTEGEVLFQELDLAQASEQALTEYRRHQVGFVFQFYNLAPMLTALENVQVASEIAQDPLDPAQALALVGLSDYQEHFPSQLSGGQQQRVAIARALAGNPRLLLCDEPTGALDLATSRQVLGLLLRLKQELGKTLVLITHNSAIAGIADRVATIRDGAIHSLHENPHPVPVQEVSW